MTEVRYPCVFISYARKDATQLALRLQTDLQSNGYEVWIDAARIRGEELWTVEIEKAIDNCDVALVLLTPGSYVSDICRAEQLRALRQQKRVIPLLAAEGTDVPLHLETVQYCDFTGAKPYDEQLRQLIAAVRTGRNGVVLQKRFRTTYVTAPPLPRNYLSRPDALVALRSAVLREHDTPEIAITVLQGMGASAKPSWRVRCVATK